MSVRATERLIGDVVIASGLPNSAKMVVQAIDEETKEIFTIWFADDHSAQTGTFPASAVDRAEQKTASAKKSGTKKAAVKKPQSKR